MYLCNSDNGIMVNFLSTASSVNSGNSLKTNGFGGGKTCALYDSLRYNTTFGIRQ